MSYGDTVIEYDVTDACEEEYQANRIQVYPKYCYDSTSDFFTEADGTVNTFARSDDG